jgi:hypothetical protein
MLTKIILPLIPVFILCLVLSIILVIDFIKRTKKRKTRAPFPKGQCFLRAPGHTLRLELELIEERIDETIMMIILIPFVVCCVLFADLYVTAFAGEKYTNYVSGFVYVISIVVPLFHFGKKFIKDKAEKRIKRKGYEGEVATGQELSLLMREGYYVFHDIEFKDKRFNVDHVVVGKNGVFVIETKYRSKKDEGDATKEATVIYDGNMLQFPDGENREFLLQAKARANSLGKWLGEEPNLDLKVVPVLSLPGWIIDEYTAKEGWEVIVMNPKQAKYFITTHTGISLSEQDIYTISEKLKEKCQDVPFTNFE